MTGVWVVRVLGVCAVAALAWSWRRSRPAPTDHTRGWFV